MTELQEFFLVAVHGGAGFHEQTYASDAEVKKAMRLACRKSIPLLESGSHALRTVEESISVLEDEPCLNAGAGSNLTIDGNVECDASVMDGSTGDYGSVGAIPGVKNPIRAARAVLYYSRIPDPLGRIPPLLLVSNAARVFVDQHGVECAPPDALVNPRSRQEWTTWKARLDSALSSHINNDRMVDDTSWNKNDIRNIQDTVGAVAWDRAGRLAAGVSSGGLLLKNSGRIGEAAVYGAGCWARQNVATNNFEHGVACSVSGSGEYIIRATLAKTISETVASSSEDTHEVLQNILANHFHQICSERGEQEPNAGVLLLVKERGEEGQITPRLWCAFTTHSMAIAYASSLDPKPKALILRRPAHSKEDKEQIYIAALPLTR